MYIKKLTQLGNSMALIVDRNMMQMMGIDAQTPLKVTFDKRRMTVEPLTEEDRSKKFDKAMQKTGEKNRELFRRLSK